MTLSNYSEGELKTVFKSVGSNVRINRNVCLFNSENISIGSNVRIDCFCLLSAGKHGIEIGDYVHVAAATHLFGSGGKIRIESFSNISSRVSIFTMSDDYVDGYLTNPMIPEEYKKMTKGNIVICKHAIIGCGSVLLPNVTVKTGGAVGALSLVNRDINAFEVAAGIPVKKIRQRKESLLKHEVELIQKYSSGC